MCRKGTHQKIGLIKAQGGVPIYTPGRLTVVAALDGQPTSACVPLIRAWMIHAWCHRMDGQMKSAKLQCKMMELLQPAVLGVL